MVVVERLFMGALGCGNGGDNGCNVSNDGDRRTGVQRPFLSSAHPIFLGPCVTSRMLQKAFLSFSGLSASCEC